MPRISALGTSVPSVRVSQDEAKAFAREHFSKRFRAVERIMPVFDHAGIEHRYVTRPVSWYAETHSQAVRNAAYIQDATALSIQSVEAALATADHKPVDIDYIIFVNTTGLATPSIDARLINRLGFRHDVRRTPIWGLGCAGGVAGLAHAYHHAIGHPQERVLVVATELCALTFLPDDYSKSNLVAAALFGDGSAAAIVVGDEVEAAGPEIVATRSTFYPDSLDVMGWNVVEQGLQVVFATRIPEIVEAHAREDATAFLSEFHLTLSDIDAFLLHPGGMKVIVAYEKAFGLPDGALSLSRAILRDYGNMSSVTVLFVLHEYMRRCGADRDVWGFVSALGPGFSSESMLIR